MNIMEFAEDAKAAATIVQEKTGIDCGYGYHIFQYIIFESHHWKTVKTVLEDHSIIYDFVCDDGGPEKNMAIIEIKTRVNEDGFILK